MHLGLILYKTFNLLIENDWDGKRMFFRAKIHKKRVADFLLKDPVEGQIAAVLEKSLYHVRRIAVGQCQSAAVFCRVDG